MTEISRSLVSDHPLYLAMCKFIKDGLEMYDYRDFYPCWGVLTVCYEILIHDLFKVNHRELDNFLKKVPDVKYLAFVTDFVKAYPHQVKKLFRLILSLPMCEYETENVGSCSSSDNKGNSNDHRRQLTDFKYDENYLTEMEDDEVVSTMREIIHRIENDQLEKTLADFAFFRYELIRRDGLLEGFFRDAYLWHLVEPICSVLDTTLNVQTIVYPEQPTIWYKLEPVGVQRCRSGILVSKDSQAYCIIRVTKDPIMSTCNDGFFKLVLNHPAKIDQLIYDMLHFKTDLGILTDAYTSVFVRLDLDSFEHNILNLKQETHEPNIVPIRYMLRDCHSAKPTLRESLLSFIYKSVEEDSKMEKKRERIQKMEEHLKLSGMAWTVEDLSRDISEQCESEPRGTLTCDSESVEKEDKEDKVFIDMPNSCDYVWVQNGDLFNTQLVRLEAICLKKFLLEPIDDKEFLIAKVYDPRVINEDYYRHCSRKEKREICDDWYRNEKHCYSILSKDHEFNSCYIRQKKGQLTVTNEELYIAIGYFNLFRYIENVPLPKDLETYEKAKKQLDIIHRNGIIHTDIRKANILYSKEGLVYFIDFAASELKKKDYGDEEFEARVEYEVDDLKIIFNIS